MKSFNNIDIIMIHGDNFVCCFHSSSKFSFLDNNVVLRLRIGTNVIKGICDNVVEGEHECCDQVKYNGGECLVFLSNTSNYDKGIKQLGCISKPNDLPIIGFSLGVGESRGVG